MTSWILDHYLDIFTVVGAITTAATLITALTPNKKDDEIVGYVRRVLEFISLRLLK